MDHIGEQLASMRCNHHDRDYYCIWISRVTENKCATVIWNSRSWRYMYLQSKCNDKPSRQIELFELYMTCVKLVKDWKERYCPD